MIFFKEKCHKKSILKKGSVPKLSFCPKGTVFCATCIFLVVFIIKISTKTTVNKCCNLIRFMV